MTTSHRDTSSRDTPHETTERDESRRVEPTAAELEDMSQPELARLAAELDPSGTFRNPFVDAYVPRG